MSKNTSRYNLATERPHRASVRLLLVDDEPESAERAAEFLEQQDERLVVSLETDPSSALDRIRDDLTGIDCIVSEYDLDGRTGLHLLDDLREKRPGFPFIIFTGDGDETLASEAISRGVTDYIAKRDADEQYAVVANRIRNAVESARMEVQYRRYLEAIETAQEGISILDEEDRFVYVSETYADFHGYDPEELLGERWSIVHPGDRDHVTEEIREAVDVEDCWRGETIGVRADGSTFRREHTVSAIGDGELVCTIRDVTDREQRERELELKNRAMDEAPVGIIITGPTEDDTPIRYANERFREMTGYEESDVLGRNCRFLQGEDTDPEPVAAMREAIADAEPVSVELRNYRKDGTEFWNRVSIAPVRDETGTVTNYVGFQENVTDPDGELLGVAGIARDLSDRLEYERRLERQNERLEEFASIVSHDLRNPLSVADGWLELVREDCDSEHLDRIANAHERMEQLIEELLILAQEGQFASELETVALTDVVEECYRTVKLGDATLVTESDLAVRADRSRLQQLLANLVCNAVDHGGDDVTVRVGALHGGEGFYVADDGPGIPEDEREKVFETGYTTSEEGIGMGLSIVKRIAEAHGWSITATESEAGGARFELTGVERAQ